MAQRRFHYEQAFEYYLRAGRLPYIAVDEARKSLIQPCRNRADGTLKSFDFVVYGPCENQLVDVKGRKCRVPTGRKSRSGGTAGRLESWVTQDDIESLGEWEELFGSGFRAYFVFIYWCKAQPPDALFQEVFAFKDRWYALRAVALSDYRKHMRLRSAKWKTVSIPTRAFAEISIPVGSFFDESSHWRGTRQHSA